MTRDEAIDLRGEITQSFISHAKDLGLYPAGNQKPSI